MRRRSQSLIRISGATEPLTIQDRSGLLRIFVLFFQLSGISFLPATATATSVVALIDKGNHSVVIAADCRVNRPGSWVSECKILEEPGCTVAIAGLYRESATVFNLRELVAAACRYPGDLREKAEAFLQLSKKPYEAAVQHIRNADPREFRQMIVDKPTEVIFGGLFRGHLALFVRGIVSDSNGKIRMERYESSDASGSPIGYFAGLNRDIQQEVEHDSQWVRQGYREAARRFVEKQISANPDLAGPPISELEIDSRGAVHWISRGACESREAD
jgi:hypothetical protein